MDTNDKTGLLAKYTRQPYAQLIKPAPAENPAPEPSDESDGPGYRALIEHREKKGNAPRFRLVDRNGQTHGCGYAYLLGWLYLPPDTLTIYTTTQVFVLSGTNLHRIEDALLRERVKQLREFKPGQDAIPGEGEPVISRLEVASR